MTYTTKQGNRVSCLALTGFTAIGKGVQLINGSPYAKTEQPCQLAYLPPYDDRLTQLDLGGRGENIGHHWALTECLLKTPSRQAIGAGRNEKELAANFTCCSCRRKLKIGVRLY